MKPMNSLSGQKEFFIVSSLDSLFYRTTDVEWYFTKSFFFTDLHLSHAFVSPFYNCTCPSYMSSRHMLILKRHSISIKLLFSTLSLLSFVRGPRVQITYRRGRWRGTFTGEDCSNYGLNNDLVICKKSLLE